MLDLDLLARFDHALRDLGTGAPCAVRVAPQARAEAPAAAGRCPFHAAAREPLREVAA
jgi:hypothetical protein